MTGLFSMLLFLFSEVEFFRDAFRFELRDQDTPYHFYPFLFVEREENSSPVFQEADACSV
jgi:hypothetical protein